MLQPVEHSCWDHMCGELGRLKFGWKRLFKIKVMVRHTTKHTELLNISANFERASFSSTHIIWKSCCRSWLVIEQVVYTKKLILVAVKLWSTHTTIKERLSQSLVEIILLKTYMTAPPLRLVKLPLDHLIIT